MRLAGRLASIKPSATLTINAKAQELKSQGRQIISLAVGEPDFAPPPHVRDAARAAVDTSSHYTAVPGLPEVRDAVAGYYKRFYGVGAPREAVIVTNGGKHALYNLFMALLDPGDEVLLPAPYWVSYPDMVALAGAMVRPVPTSAEAGFLTTVEDLDKAWTPACRAIILNTPSNPTGCHYAQPQLDAIADWALAKGLFIVSDEVYDQLVFAPAEPSTLSGWWERHSESVAIIGALSKTFAMPGWRFGSCLAHPDMVKAMSKIQSQSTSNVCAITQRAGLAALTGPWQVVAAMRASFASRRDLVMQIIASWPGVVCPRPDGAFYVFPDVSSRYTASTPDSTSLCARLLDEAGVALVPGAAFGDDGCVRISYAVDEATLTEALDKVGRVLAAL